LLAVDLLGLITSQIKMHMFKVEDTPLSFAKKKVQVNTAATPNTKVRGKEEGEGRKTREGQGREGQGREGQGREGQGREGQQGEPEKKNEKSG